MKNHKLAPKIMAFVLAVGLALPSSALALRQTGLEESSERERLARALGVPLNGNRVGLPGGVHTPELISSRSGLEDVLYPNPVELYGQDPNPTSKNLTFLNRDLQLIDLIENQILPDLVRRKHPNHSLMHARHLSIQKTWFQTKKKTFTHNAFCVFADYRFYDHVCPRTIPGSICGMYDVVCFSAACSMAGAV